MIEFEKKLNKEFGGSVKIYQEVDYSYTIFVYKPNNDYYFSMYIQNNFTITLIEFFNYVITDIIPLSDFDWLIYCIKKSKWDDLVIYMYKDTALKREFLINKILNDI